MHYIGQPIRLLKPVTTLCYAGAQEGTLMIPAGTSGVIFYVPTRLGCPILKAVFTMPGHFTGSERSGKCDWIAPIAETDFEVLVEVERVVVMTRDLLLKLSDGLLIGARNLHVAGEKLQSLGRWLQAC